MRASASTIERINARLMLFHPCSAQWSHSCTRHPPPPPHPHPAKFNSKPLNTAQQQQHTTTTTVELHAQYHKRTLTLNP